MTGRYYMVTFDITPSKGRNNDYKMVNDSLMMQFGMSNYWSIVKQCCIIRTARDARSIRDSISQKLGSDCNILVVRLRRGYAFKLIDPVKRQNAQNVLSQIPA